MKFEHDVSTIECRVGYVRDMTVKIGEMQKKGFGLVSTSFIQGQHGQPATIHLFWKRESMK